MMAKQKQPMKAAAIEGSTADVRVPATSYADDVYYDVILRRPVEFPELSGNYLNPSDKVQLRGRVIKTLGDAVAEAYEAKTT